MSIALLFYRYLIYKYGPKNPVIDSFEEYDELLQRKTELLAKGLPPTETEPFSEYLNVRLRIKGHTDQVLAERQLKDKN